jgi:tetratricopeptide (TPR) repeat protein
LVKFKYFYQGPFIVNKNQLHTLLGEYSTSSLPQAEAIAVLRHQYPYSQVFHVLAARTAKDHNFANQQALLQLAAVYSTDRSVLKEIMTSPSLQVPTEETPDHATHTDTTGIDYAVEIIHDMERLHELKDKFEKMFMNSEPEALTNTPPQAPENAEEAEFSETERKRSKRQRLIALAKELIPEEQREDSKKTVRRDSEHNPIIEEIRATKKKIQPANEKTKEQIELIEHYINTKPSRTPPKAKEEANLDLASTLKSGEFGENIVSETLAEILVKQGKKEKAIEVYKKLIWKFPQKKAYFAAQIEDLRK